MHGLNMWFKWINNSTTGKSVKMTVIGRAVMATVLGLLLSTCLIQPLSMSTSTLFSSPEKRDFQLPDLFAQIANNRPVRKLDDRIVIVNIGRSNRDEIAEGLSLLSLCGPKAVGVDINFAEPSADDTSLIEALNSLPEVILPLGLSSSKIDGEFKIEDKPFFFEDCPDLKYGVVNLPMNSQKGTVREYAIEFPTELGLLPSFVTALAEAQDPNIVEKLKTHGSETGITSFHSREYQILNLDEIEEHPEELTDKIVIVGALEDAGDMHATPVQSHVSGVMLHASALSTVMDGTWFRKIPKTYDYILALTLCFGIMLIVYGFKSNFKGILLRLVQATLAILAVRIGYGLYVDHNIIFDISFTVTIVAFGLFAVDIWNCIEELWKICSEKINKLDIKYNTQAKSC